MTAGTCSAFPATEHGASTMVRSFLVRGMLVGLLAGLCAFVFGFVAGEPSIQGAIDFEEFGAAGPTATAEPAPAEEEPVSRSMQRSAGLLTATMLYGVGMGGIFGLLFAAAAGRMGRVGARGSSVLLAGAAYVTVILVPFLKYSANPPAVGRGETIGRRSALYFTLVLISVIVAVSCVRLGRYLAQRFDGWNAALAAGAVFVAVIGVVYAVMPTVNEVPADFPASVLWRFRVGALGTNLVLWTTIGLAFGELTRRSLQRQPVGQAPRSSRSPSTLR
jgi:predicted cobalt transporter CbtA